jgi:Flp pilus assembly protein CpaB
VKRSNRLVILVGVLLAVLAFVAIVILLNQREAAETPEEQTDTVLVATEQIDIGEEVTPDKVEAAEVQPDAVQGTALSDTSAVSGQPAVFTIPQGSQVTAESIGLGDPLAVNIPQLLNPGEKAVSFQVERVGGLDFLVKPGDTIDVIVTAELQVLQPTQDSAESADPNAPVRLEPVPGLEAARSVKAVLQDRRVIYVSATRATEQEPIDTNGDGVIDENDEQPAAQVIESVVIVFAGSTQDAEVMRFAQRDVGEQGSLSVVVRHADDDEVVETLGITIDQLVDEFGLRVPNIVERLEEEEAP